MTVFVHINTFYVLSHCKNNGEGWDGCWLLSQQQFAKRAINDDFQPEKNDQVSWQAMLH